MRLWTNWCQASTSLPKSSPVAWASETRARRRIAGSSFCRASLRACQASGSLRAPMALAAARRTSMLSSLLSVAASTAQTRVPPCAASRRTRRCAPACRCLARRRATLPRRPGWRKTTAPPLVRHAGSDRSPAADVRPVAARRPAAESRAFAVQPGQITQLAQHVQLASVRSGPDRPGGSGGTDSQTRGRDSEYPSHPTTMAKASSAAAGLSHDPCQGTFSRVRMGPFMDSNSLRTG